MGKRGEGEGSTFEMWEELTHLRVTPDAEPPYIYKRVDSERNKKPEDKKYHVTIPIPPNDEGRTYGNGVRKSLRTVDRNRAIEKVEDLVLDIKSDLRNNTEVMKVSVKSFVDIFLKWKKQYIRDESEGKSDAGSRSLVQGRWDTTETKLRRYFIPFIGGNKDLKKVTYKKFDKDWEMWRKEPSQLTTTKGKKPAQSTVKMEMSIIREIWGWGQTYKYIDDGQLKPFQGVNLIQDSKTRRDTWTTQEWNDFVVSIKGWKDSIIQNSSPERMWDVFVGWNLFFLLANSGLRTGELFKLKWKDLAYRNILNPVSDEHKTGVFISVPNNTKTGYRKAFSNGGEYLKCIQRKSKFTSKDDYVVTHLDGKKWTTRQFRDDIFYPMTDHTNENTRLGKKLKPYALRHFYATTRLLNGTPIGKVALNMGCKEKQIRDHYSHEIEQAEEYSAEFLKYKDRDSSEVFGKEILATDMVYQNIRFIRDSAVSNQSVSNNKEIYDDLLFTDEVKW